LPFDAIGCYVKFARFKCCFFPNCPARWHNSGKIRWKTQLLRYKTSLFRKQFLRTASL